MRVYTSVPASGRVTVESQTPARLSLEFAARGDTPPRIRNLRPLTPGSPRDVFLWPGVKLIIEEER